MRKTLAIIAFIVPCALAAVALSAPSSSLAQAANKVSIYLSDTATKFTATATSGNQAYVLADGAKICLDGSSCTKALTSGGLNVPLSGNATTATALAANGSNCTSAQAAIGVDASGAAEGCWSPATTVTNTFTGQQTMAASTSSIVGLKLTSGATLTSPSAGAFEFVGDDLFFTVTTGPTRKTVAFTDTNITGTAANVSGTPALPDGTTATKQSVDDNSDKLATDSFVLAQAASANPVIAGTAAPGTSTRYARADHVHPTDTTRAAVTQEAWNVVGAGGKPAFQNSWANLGAPYPSMQYFKDTLGVVHVQGAVASGTSLSVIFTLPAGYRPLHNLSFPAYSDSGFSLIAVYANGDVKEEVGGVTYLMGNAISFLAEQ